jgi:hypothetical protein
VRFESLDELVEAAGLRDRNRPSRACPEQLSSENELLGRLVAVAQDDDLAARVVLDPRPDWTGGRFRWDCSTYVPRDPGDSSILMIDHDD